MEKTFANAIPKEDPRQNLDGCKPAAAELIAVDVDPEAFGCPRCLRPLVPPVLQCASGYLACSSCHGNLPDKNKCASCFIKTGYTRRFMPTAYSRFFAVERVLRSVRVPCANSFYGCTAGRMAYNQNVEHDKTCPWGGLAQRVVKMGPCDGGCGDGWDMDVRGVSHIDKVVVWHRRCAIDAMSVLYEKNGRLEWTKLWGKPTIAGERSESDEHLTGIRGHAGNYKYDRRFVVRSLTFVSNRRTFGPYGEEEGAPFELPAAGGRIVGFHGRSDFYMVALGTYIRKLA